MIIANKRKIMDSFRYVTLAVTHPIINIIINILHVYIITFDSVSNYRTVLAITTLTIMNLFSYIHAKIKSKIVDEEHKELMEQLRKDNKLLLEKLEKLEQNNESMEEKLEQNNESIEEKLEQNKESMEEKLEQNKEYIKEVMHAIINIHSSKKSKKVRKKKNKKNKYMYVHMKSKK